MKIRNAACAILAGIAMTAGAIADAGWFCKSGNCNTAPQCNNNCPAECNNQPCNQGLCGRLLSHCHCGWYTDGGWTIANGPCFQSRFLQRPYPPYHGCNRPFYGWSSNYRPYYFTPQSYANEPWNYGPAGREYFYQSAAPPQGLNQLNVLPASATTTITSPAAQPTLATPYVPPVATPSAAPATPPMPIEAPAIPEVPPPPKPGI